MKIASVIVAAGRGTRAGGDVSKQYARIGGRPVLTHTLEAFARHPAITDIVVMIASEDRQLFEQAAAGIDKVRASVEGGPTRQDTVRRGLTAIEHYAPDLVLIHDAARPFVDTATISRVIAALKAHPGAIAGIPVADTLKSAATDGTIANTVARAGLWRAQTPQGFRYAGIRAAHDAAAAQGRNDFTDDAAIAEWAGLPVALVEGSARNIKITNAEDLALADRDMRATATLDVRTGSGFDVHTFAEGDHVWLGGVKIPHTHRLEGHSDADVVLHALTDALLGAIGEADIGQHFPPSDPQWKGAPSRIFLEHAAKLVAEKGYAISNVDITVLAEAPKIGPNRPAMKALIAGVLGIAPDRVGIKATTMEGMGFVGRREGIAAMATATIQSARR